MTAKAAAMIFPDQNSTNFPLSVRNNLKSIAKKHSAKDFLRYHQYVVYNYLIINPKARGLLLFHEMGLGKSISAVALAEFYRTHDPDRKIIVLLSKSLQANFKKNIAKFIQRSDLDNNMSDGEIDAAIDTSYNFVSLNASNMFTQMTRVGKTAEEVAVEKQLQKFTQVVDRDDFLENSVLIIDEYHNLANSITNGSTNAISLYDTIMNTKNIKLIFLTGTPIVNNPFELCPTFNMIKGYLPVKGTVNLKTPLFPELREDFEKYFVDEKTNKIKNKNRFENRIFGLLSYYGSLYFGKNQQDGFPKQLPTKIARIPMSPEQFTAYAAARDAEREEASFGVASVSTRFSSKSSVSSTYRVKSRQISNFLIPDSALTHNGRKVTKHIDKITDAYIKNLSIASPKFAKILGNINTHKGQLGLFYSEFVSGEGIALFARALTLQGYKYWNKIIHADTSSAAFGIKRRKKPHKIQGGASNKTYAIISGDVDFDVRAKIVKSFNAADNIHGERISLLLISKTGAEGLDLKNVRHIHICEPYWNMARVDQIIARGVRYLSHVALPAKDRNVQPYIYLSDYPKTFNMKKKKEETTDVHMNQGAMHMKILIDQFYISLANGSIDCSMHEAQRAKGTNIKCKMCSPTDRQLYNAILSKDLMLPDPCKELKSGRVETKEIIINDTKYYYAPDKSIFKYDKALDGYVPMQSHESGYAEIMAAIL
jgi:hypothetical protein